MRGSDSSDGESSSENAEQYQEYIPSNYIRKTSQKQQLLEQQDASSNRGAADADAIFAAGEEEVVFGSLTDLNQT